VSIIHGERVRLRAVERSDVEKFHTWINDPEVTEGLALYLPMSMRDEESWFDGIASRPPQEKPLAIECRDGDGWKLIGNSGFFDLDRTAHSGEIGIMIGDKSYWNKGYGTEAMSLLLQHGFETLNLHRIFLRVYVSNPRAIRSYEKSGFIPEGRLREAVYQHGRYGDVLIMSVLRPEWDAKRK
jgi:RimJ/RimL family protein N-acetyltransferase